MKATAISSILLLSITPLAHAEPFSLTTPTGTLAATLELPAAPAPFPVLLIIPGSGPTNRDGNGPGLAAQPYKLLAHALAAEGFASLRYDKRGIGDSAAAAALKESDLRFDHYVDDAARFAQTLAADPRFSRVILLGHSEGSLIGMLAAQRAKPHAFISIAGPGRPAPDLLREQTRAALPPALLAESNKILDALVAGNTVADTPPLLAPLFRPSVQPYLISWFRHDPAQEAAKLTLPFLILQGTTDLQVPANDAKRLAAANPTAQLALIEGMNHVLKSTPADRPANLRAYADPTLPLAKDLLPTLTRFLKTTTAHPGATQPVSPRP